MARQREVTCPPPTAQSYCPAAETRCALAGQSSSSATTSPTSAAEQVDRRRHAVLLTPEPVVDGLKGPRVRRAETAPGR